MEENHGNALSVTSLESSQVDNESDSQTKIESISTNTNTTTATNEMDTQMKLLVQILQNFGGYPIKIKIPVKKNSKKKDNSNNILNIQNNKIDNVYETTMLKWTEARAWYSYITFALKTFTVLTYLGNIGWGIPYPAKLFSVGAELQNMFWTKQENTDYNSIAFAGNVVLKIIKSILVFWNTPEFVCWLNNWSYFERDFKNCFKTNVKWNIRRFSNRVLFLYVALTSLVWTVTSIKWIPMYIYHVGFVSIACMIFAIIATFIHPLLEDAKVLIILKTQVLAFEQILVGIKGYENCQTLKISADDVIGWQNLVKQARDQTALASEYIKGQEMMSVAETILSGSAVASFVLRALTRDDLMQKSVIFALLINLYSCSQYMARLYIKVLLAEKIPAATQLPGSFNELKERLVADEVLKVESKTGDAVAKIELKFLYTQMDQNGVVINLGNYFALDKKLLLNVGAQVVTYLIVIMQFESTNK